MGIILHVENLYTVFEVKRGTARIVNGFNLDLEEGHLLGLVGESGSGKTVVADSMMGMVRKPGIIQKGKVVFHGKNGDVDLLTLDIKQIREYRGKLISLIAANPRSHLNPIYTVGEQIATVYMAHNECTKKEAFEKALDMLKAVGLTDPEQRMKAYPHELSGGMAQRCMIAMALVNKPAVLIADDATNGLDVTVQAQIMELITDMVTGRNMSGIFITHDLGVVAQCCTDIAILYCGQIVEQASVKDFFSNPIHPYSIKLLNSLPETRRGEIEPTEDADLKKIDPVNLPSGCIFHPRCKYATETCSSEEPDVVNLGEGHCVKCHYAEAIARKEVL